MSRELLKSYERDFEQCMSQIRAILDDSRQVKQLTTSKCFLTFEILQKTPMNTTRPKTILSKWKLNA